MQDHTIDGDVVTIHIVRLNGDKYDVMVDLIDWIEIKLHSIYIWTDCNNRAYAMLKVAGKNWLLHRFLLKPPSDLQVDHKDGNTLRNVRSNIRVCTQYENKQNIIKLRSDNTSCMLNVSWHKGNAKWAARVQLDGITKFLGYYTELAEAGFIIACFRALYLPFSAEAREFTNIISDDIKNKLHVIVSKKHNGEDTQVNSKSGVRGVSWDAKMKLWNCQVTINGKTNQLGYYSDIKEAAEVVKRFRKEARDATECSNSG
jgi:hypothetical protein